MFERHELTNQACSFLNSSLSGKFLGREGAAPDKRSKRKTPKHDMNFFESQRQRKVNWEAYRNDHPSWACTLGLIALAKAYSVLQQRSKLIMID